MNMTEKEKLDVLLEWALKTQEALEQTMDTLNEIIVHLNDYNGQAFSWLKKPKRINES